MKQFLIILLVAIVVIGSCYAQDENGDPIQPHHIYGEGIQQPYGQGPLAQLTIQWEPMDTTFMLTVFTDSTGDVLSLTSIKFFGGYQRIAETISAPVDTEIRIPIEYTQAVFIRTIFGITAVTLMRDPASGKGVMLVNGKIIFLLDTVNSAVNDVEGSNQDPDVYQNTKWQWHNVYDLWVSRQVKNKAKFIDIKKEGLVY